MPEPLCTDRKTLHLCVCCFSPSCLNRSRPFYQPESSPSPVTCHYCSLPSLHLHLKACRSSWFRLQQTSDCTWPPHPSNKSNNSMAAETEIRRRVLQSQTSICVHFSLLPLRPTPSLWCPRLTQVYHLLLHADALLPLPPSSVCPAEEGLPGRD